MAVKVKGHVAYHVGDLFTLPSDLKSGAVLLNLSLFEVLTSSDD